MFASPVMQFEEERSSTATDSSPQEDDPPSLWERLRLQRGPWLRSLLRHRSRYLASGALLLGQAPLLACRPLLREDSRWALSAACWALASAHFLLHWTLVPEMPPWLASGEGDPTE